MDKLIFYFWKKLLIQKPENAILHGSISKRSIGIACWNINLSWKINNKDYLVILEIHIWVENFIKAKSLIESELLQTLMFK